MEAKPLFRTVILFLTAYCIYISLEVTYRGCSYALMGIVAGFCVLLIDPLNDRISWDMPLLLQMFVSMCIICTLEVLSGEFALHVLKIRMWDYSGQWGNRFDALFCPFFAGIWYLLSGIAIVLCDAIDYYVLCGEMRPYYRILSWRGKPHELPERKC